MRLVPLTVEAAMAGLIQMTRRTLAMDTKALERADDGPTIAGRVKFEVRNVRIILRQLERLDLGYLVDLPHFRRKQVDVLHLVALLGEGVLALDSLAFLLASASDVDGAAFSQTEKLEELVDAIWKLQDFRTSIWLLLDVLESPYKSGVPDSIDSFSTAIACLLDGDSKVAKRLRDSDLYTVQLRKPAAPDSSTPPANLTLADMESVMNMSVPVCSGDLLDPSLYAFDGTVAVDQEVQAQPSPRGSSSDSSFSTPILTPPSSPSPSTRSHDRHASINTILSPPSDKASSAPPPVLKTAPPTSCALIFHLPQTTPSMILHLFQHALSVSPRFKTRDLPDLFNPPTLSELLLRQPKPSQEARPPHDIVAKFRLHNLTHARRESLTTEEAKEEQEIQVRFQKQHKLRCLSDHQLRQLCVEVYDELVRRNIVDKRLKALVDSGVGGGDGGYMVGGPNVREEDVEVPPFRTSLAPFSHGAGDSSGSGSGEQAGTRKTLAGMEDQKFLELCGDACWELRRRDVEATAAAGKEKGTGQDGSAGREAEERGKVMGETKTQPLESEDDDSDDYEADDDESEGQDDEEGGDGPVRGGGLKEARRSHADMVDEGKHPTFQGNLCDQDNSIVATRSDKMIDDENDSTDEEDLNEGSDWWKEFE